MLTCEVITWEEAERRLFGETPYLCVGDEIFIVEMMRHRIPSEKGSVVDALRKVTEKGSLFGF